MVADVIDGERAARGGWRDASKSLLPERAVRLETSRRLCALPAAHTKASQQR